NDQELVKILAEKSPELVLELERMGALFQRDETGGKYLLRIDGGHTHPRCPYLEDRTGREMVRAMVSELRKRDVPFYKNIMITELLKDGERISGAAGICLETLEPVLFECKSIILATGGAGMIYENTDNSIDLTGDGYALGLEAGASLRDMEFVQFYPLGFLFPPSLKGMLGGLLYYCRLYNSQGERFMEKYDPERLELSTRDRVSRAIMQEVREGRGGPLGGIFIDLTFQEPGFVKKMTPGLYETYVNFGFDPEKEQIEMAPTVHFFMGGLAINKDWQTQVPGLFGAGEAAGGMHGGNRLSQNALAEIIVSGAVSGENAAKYSLGLRNEEVHLDPKIAEAQVDMVEEMMNRDEGVSPVEVRKKLREIMTAHVGVFRTEESLKKALKEIEELEKTEVRISSKSKYMNKELIEAIENRNMFTTAKTVVLSAIHRKESRGAHYRSDYPETDNSNYLLNIFLRKDGDGLTVDKKPTDLSILGLEVEE
ncbi:MAG: FAD-binding protein, partial [Clostridia bacterium]|nr:FAD-binding protein [Clostridia bacterium]